MHGDPQMMHAPVHDRQAICPSTRTGSIGCLLHIGHSSNVDAGCQLSGATRGAVDGSAPLRTVLVQVEAVGRTFRVGTLDSVEA
jgi:hypothetical protein